MKVASYTFRITSACLPCIPDPNSHKFNQCFVTKLLKNFRSHRDLLKLPSDMFYEGELIFAAGRTFSCIPGEIIFNFSLVEMPTWNR